MPSDEADELEAMLRKAEQLALQMSENASQTSDGAPALSDRQFAAPPPVMDPSFTSYLREQEGAEGSVYSMMSSVQHERSVVSNPLPSHQQPEQEDEFEAMLRKAEALAEQMKTTSASLETTRTESVPSIHMKLSDDSELENAYRMASKHRQIAQSSPPSETYSSTLKGEGLIDGYSSFMSPPSRMKNDTEAMLRKADLLGHNVNSVEDVAKELSFEPSPIAREPGVVSAEERLLQQNQLALESLQEIASSVQTGQDLFTQEGATTVPRANWMSHGRPPRPPAADIPGNSGDTVVSESAEHAAKAEEMTRLMQQALNSYEDNGHNTKVQGAAALMDKAIATLQSSPRGLETPTSVAIHTTGMDQDDMSSVGSGSAMSFHFRNQMSASGLTFPRRSSHNQDPDSHLYGALHPISPQNARDLSSTPSPKPPSPPPGMKRSLPSMASTHACSNLSSDVKGIDASSPSDNIRWEKVENAEVNDDDYVPLVDYSKVSPAKRDLNFGSYGGTSKSSRRKPLLTKRQAKRILRRVFRLIIAVVVLRFALKWFWPAKTDSTETPVAAAPEKVVTSTQMPQVPVETAKEAEKVEEAHNDVTGSRVTEKAEEPVEEPSTKMNDEAVENDGKIDVEGATDQIQPTGEGQVELDDSVESDETVESEDNNELEEAVEEDEADKNVETETELEEDEEPIVITPEEIAAYLAEMGEDFDDYPDDDVDIEASAPEENYSTEELPVTEDEAVGSNEGEGPEAMEDGENTENRLQDYDFNEEIDGNLFTTESEADWTKEDHLTTAEEIAVIEEELPATENDLPASDQAPPAVEDLVAVNEEELATMKNEVTVIEEKLSASENEVIVDEKEDLPTEEEIADIEEELSASENEVIVDESKLSTVEDEVREYELPSTKEKETADENDVPTVENEVEKELPTIEDKVARSNLDLTTKPEVVGIKEELPITEDEVLQATAFELSAKRTEFNGVSTEVLTNAENVSSGGFHVTDKYDSVSEGNTGSVPLSASSSMHGGKLEHIDKSHAHPKHCWIPFAHLKSEACKHSVKKKPMFDAEQLINAMMQ